MKIALLNETNNILQVGSLAEVFPNTSFTDLGIDFDFLIEKNAKVIKENRYYDQKIEKLIECEPYLENNEVYSVQVVAKTPEELQEDLNVLAMAIRLQRNELLQQSDWTQVADAPVDKQIWAEYRQQLRDITSQSNFPNDVIFPQLSN